MIDKYATLLHHFLQIALTQRIRCIPTNAHQIHVGREAHPFGNQRPVSIHAGSTSSPTDIRVAFALTPKRALRSMAGDEHGGIAHGPQALNNAGNQRVMVALR